MTYQELCDQSKYFKAIISFEPRPMMDRKTIEAYRTARANWKREYNEWLKKQQH